MEALPQSPSYIIVADRKPAGETWNRSVATRLAKRKGVKAVPVKEYLASLNSK